MLLAQSFCPLFSVQNHCWAFTKDHFSSQFGHSCSHRNRFLLRYVRALEKLGHAGSCLKRRHDPPMKTGENSHWGSLVALLCRVVKGTCWIIVSWRVTYSRLGSTSQDQNPQLKYLHNVFMSFAGIIFRSSIHEFSFPLWVNGIFCSHLLEVQEQEKGIRCGEEHGAFLCWYRRTAKFWNRTHGTYWTPGSLAFVPSVWISRALFPSLGFSLRPGGWCG